VLPDIGNFSGAHLFCASADELPTSDRCRFASRWREVNGRRLEKPDNAFGPIIADASSNPYLKWQDDARARNCQPAGDLPFRGGQHNHSSLGR
jgi:hypothetical protein